MGDREIPAPYRGHAREPGFEAIRNAYGEMVVQQILNWPRLAEVYTVAQGGDRDMVIREVKTAERNVRRAGSDKDYAMNQARLIVERIDPRDIGTIPTVTQLRRSWGFSDDLSPLSPLEG